jgi:hypothetical protein
MWSSTLGDSRHCSAVASTATISEVRALLEPREFLPMTRKSRLVLRLVFMPVVWGLFYSFPLAPSGFGRAGPIS